MIDAPPPVEPQNEKPASHFEQVVEEKQQNANLASDVESPNLPEISPPKTNEIEPEKKPSVPQPETPEIQPPKQEESQEAPKGAEKTPEAAETPEAPQTSEAPETPKAPETSSSDSKGSKELKVAEKKSEAAETPKAPETAISDSRESEELKVAPKPRSEDLLARAKELKKTFADGFQWSDLGSIIKQSYEFASSYKSLTKEEMEVCVVEIINHVIDLTDTPYLPDRFTDPMFKAMVPPFISLFGDAIFGKIEFLPTAESKKPDGEALEKFATELTGAFADGFQWHDLATVVNSSLKFIGSYPFLNVEEKKECVVTIVNHVIDKTDTPKLPDHFIDPVFKSLVPSFVEVLFANL